MKQLKRFVFSAGLVCVGLLSMGVAQATDPALQSQRQQILLDKQKLEADKQALRAAKANHQDTTQAQQAVAADKSKLEADKQAFKAAKAARRAAKSATHSAN